MCPSKITALLACLAIVAGAAAEPASQPATTTAIAAPSERQASILLQLANAEANIKAINKALVRTGYKVGLAYEQKEGAERGNELMDRKGGGPVPWDQFYGRTAMDFYHHASADLRYDAGRGAKTLDAHWTGGTLTKVDRPAQFDSIYRANDQQAARAQEQIASLLQDQAALLARRQKHEADQSALWAELALEGVKDREIAFRPVYRFKLVPEGPRAELLRGPIQFLTEMDRSVGDVAERVESNQSDALANLQTRAKAAYAALQEAVARAAYAEGVTDEDRAKVDALKGTCKQVADECTVILDNYRKAAESDLAKEDASKLEYRAHLQTAFAKLAERIGALDDQTMALTTAWSMKPHPVKEAADRPATAPAPELAQQQPAVNRRSELPGLEALLTMTEAIKPDAELATGEVLKGEYSVPAKHYRLSGTLQVGQDEPQGDRASLAEASAVAQVHVSAGTLIEGGRILVEGGVVRFEGSAEHPVVLRDVALDACCSTRVYADYVVFDHCTFGKEDARSTDYGVKWAISHSVLRASNFKRLTRQDAGVQLERCALIDCRIPGRTFGGGGKGGDAPEIARRLKDGWNDVAECDFYHCTIETPFYFMMRRCNVTDCKALGSGRFSGKESVVVQIGQFDADRGLLDDLRAMTTSAGPGEVTYSVRTEPYWNPTKLLNAAGAPVAAR